MTLDEEIEYLKLSLSTLNTVFENIDNISSFVKLYDDGSSFAIYNDHVGYFSVGYSRRDGDQYQSILAYQPSYFINTRLNGIWILNHHESSIAEDNNNTFTDEYSVLNSTEFSDELLELEKWFDSLMTNKRIPTEEEYFQGTLLLKDLTLIYEDFVKVLSFLHEHKRYAPSIKNVCSTAYLKFASFDIIKKVRTAITEQTGIEFQ